MDRPEDKFLHSHGWGHEFNILYDKFAIFSAWRTENNLLYAL